MHTSSLQTLAAFTLVLGLCSANGCVSTTYEGVSYQPTNSVDLYTDVRDIPVEYEVMGTAEATASNLADYEQLEIKLIREAMANGADAVVLNPLEERILATNRYRPEYRNEFPRYYRDELGRVQRTGGARQSPRQMYDETEKIKVLSGSLVKYHESTPETPSNSSSESEES